MKHISACRLGSLVRCAVAAVMLGASPLFGAAIDRRDDQILRSADGTREIIRYSIQIPAAIAADTRLPMVVLFHGTRLTAAKEVLWTDEVLQAMGRRGDVILLAPEGGTGQGPRQGRRQAVAELVDWARRTLPVDHRRIVFAGFSAGGAFILHELIHEHREGIAGAITFGMGGARALSTLRPGRDPDILLVHGTLDAPQRARTYVEQTRKNGHRVVYREIREADHGNVLGIPDTRNSRNRADLILWSLALRAGAVAPPDTSLDALRRLAAQGDRVQLTPQILRAVSTVGGAESGALVKVWLESSRSDLRLAAARLSRDTTFAGVTVPGLLHSAAQGDEAGKEAALALGRLASWRYEEARRGLVTLARHRQREVRAFAAMGLHEAVAFTIYGAHEDQSLFAALVGLLADDEPVIRGLAWSALTQDMPPVRPRMSPPRLPPDGNFDPQQPVRSQMATITAWQQWVRGLPDGL